MPLVCLNWASTPPTKPHLVMVDLTNNKITVICFTYICMKRKKDIQDETLKPIIKIKSEEDKELQELEVESTDGGMGVGEG
jgi:hypothetical protein